MKKIYSTLIIAFAVINLYNNASAQKANNIFDGKIDVEKIITETHLNDVNIRAVRDFIKSYQNISDAKWYAVKDGFIVKFKKDNVETKVEYDNKGNRHFVLNTYDEFHLPFDIRDMVKKQYYDYNILVAYEINYNTGVAYIIKIEDKTKLKVLKIMNDEMAVMEDYVKN